jgi:hypothetical protein
MPEFAGYWFDENGVGHRRSHAYFQVWTELEAIEASGFFPPRGSASYDVVLEFARGRQVRLKVKPDWRGRLPMAQLSATLALAASRAPAAAEVSPTVKFLIEWGDAGKDALRRVGRWESSGEMLLQAAKWRWAQLDGSRADLFARRASKRLPLDVRPHQFRLQLELNGPMSGKRLLARAAQVLAFDPDDRAARSAMLRARLMLGVETAESEAEAWLEREPADREIAVAVAVHRELHGRFADAATSWSRIGEREVRSALRDACDANRRRLERLVNDPVHRRRHFRGIWWRKAAFRGWLALWILAAGFSAYSKFTANERRSRAEARARERADQASRERQAELDRERRVLEAKAEAGEVAAMMELARQYGTVFPVSRRNPARAYAWYLRAAEAGHGPAMILVAGVILKGEGTTKNVAEAVGWLEKAATSGTGSAAYTLGELYNDGRDVPQDHGLAFRWYDHAAGLGHVAARGKLARLHQRGLGTPKNASAAAEIYREQADQGDPVAAFRLGSMFERGEGVTRDPTAAVQWYKRAAEGKNAAALLQLAAIHMDGKGVAVDQPRAVAFLRQAADLKDRRAQLALSELKWIGRVLRQDKSAARTEVEAMVRQGYVPARELFGRMLLEDSKPESLSRAREIFSDLAEHGQPASRTRYGLMCLEGLGGPRDIDGAREALRRAAEAGSHLAAFFLAGMTMGYGDRNASRDPEAARAALLLPGMRTGEMGREFLARLDAGSDVANWLAGTDHVQNAPEDVSSVSDSADLPANRAAAPVFQLRPKYPLALRFLGVTGEVLIDLRISSEGEVVSANAVRSPVAALETSALAAVLQWRFKPAIKEGRPVEIVQRLPIQFTLNEVESETGSGRATAPGSP